MAAADDETDRRNRKWSATFTSMLVVLIALPFHFRPVVSFSMLPPQVPRQLNDVREFRVVEELSPHTFVGNLVTELRLDAHYDPPTVDRLRFSFLTRPSQLDKDYFAIDERSGVIHTTGERLDREALCPGGVIDCVIQYDVAIKPMEYFQIVKVKIDIADVNDHTPEFASRRVQHRIAESKEPDPEAGIPIPAAVDLDSGRNGIQRYDLITVGDNTDGEEKFALSERQTADGRTDLRLVLTEKLDRESVDRYQFAVVATDGGVPPMSGSMLIDIMVVDVNDNAPQFDNNGTYEVHVREDIAAGKPILRVRARDIDVGQNAIVTYFFSPLTERQHGNVFAIKPETGSIYVKQGAGGVGALDHESTAIYLLSVTAVDNGQDPLTAHATVVVHVDDVNDNAPSIRVNTLVTPSPFDSESRDHPFHGPYGVQIPDSSVALQAQVVENAQPGTFVAYVSVSDPDSGEYGRFRCSVYTVSLDDATNPAGSSMKTNFDDNFPFALHQTFPPADFQLVAVASLDREQQKAYDVTITCSDFGERKSSAVVQVEVTDVNDNEPRFTKSSYDFELIENCPNGTELGVVLATDDDSGTNGEVVYQLLGPDFLLSRFSIDRFSGMVSTRNVIDREELFVEDPQTNYDDLRGISSLELVVVASDRGSPSHSATAGIVINVVDLDDDRPRFQTDHFVLSILENQSSGTEVGKVVAIDRDLPPNNRFRYQLNKKWGSEPDDVPFDVDPLTGMITSSEIFDRERIQEYQLDVVAVPEVIAGQHSVISSGLTATARVTVRIEDVNDNRPMFVSPLVDNQTVLVSNKAPRGHVIAVVRAVDHDTGPNADLTYSITSGSGSMFSVHPKKGRLSVSGDLSEIMLQDFLLKLSVRDKGLSVQLNDSAELRVVVSRDVTYIPHPVVWPPDDDDGDTDIAYHHKDDHYMGVLASEATAVVLGVALAAILTAILVVAVTICVVRRRSAGNSGRILLVPAERRNGTSRTKFGRYDPADKNDGRGSNAPAKCRESGPSVVDGSAGNWQQTMIGRDQQLFGCNGKLSPLNNGGSMLTSSTSGRTAVNNSLPLERQSPHAIPLRHLSTSSACRYPSATFTDQYGDDDCREHSGILSATQTTGGALHLHLAEAAPCSSQTTSFSSATGLSSIARSPYIETTRNDDVIKMTDPNDDPDFLHSTLEETTSERKPVVVFVKDLIPSPPPQPPIPSSSRGLFYHHVTQAVGTTTSRRRQQLLDVERDSVGSASNTDSGNGNSSEYNSGHDSDPSPPNNSACDPAAVPTSGCYVGSTEGAVPGSSSYSPCSHPSATAFRPVPAADTAAVMTSSRLMQPPRQLPLGDSAVGMSGPPWYQTLPSRHMVTDRRRGVVTPAGSSQVVGCRNRQQFPVTAAPLPYSQLYNSVNCSTDTIEPLLPYLVAGQTSGYPVSSQERGILDARMTTGFPDRYVGRLPTHRKLKSTTSELDINRHMTGVDPEPRQNFSPVLFDRNVTAVVANDVGSSFYDNVGVSSAIAEAKRSLGLSLQQLPDTNV